MCRHIWALMCIMATPGYPCSCTCATPQASLIHGSIHLVQCYYGIVSTWHKAIMQWSKLSSVTIANLLATATFVTGRLQASSGAAMEMEDINQTKGTV